MIETLNEKNEVFTDNSFPAKLNSVEGTSKDPSKMDDIKRFCDGWRRATEFPSA